MVKKIIFALSLLTAGAPYAAAQSQGITINVTSADDGEPVVGAAVLIQDSKVGGVTDVDGKLTISKLPVAAKKLTISYLGMQTQTVLSRVISSMWCLPQMQPTLTRWW